MLKRQKGLVLPLVISLVVILTIVGFALLTLAEQEIIQTRIENDKTRAFYYAEAGIAKLSEKLERTYIGDLDETFEAPIDQGNFSVDVDTNSFPYYAISTGVSGVVQKKIRVKINYLAVPYENAIYSLNASSVQWALQLRGTGDPVLVGNKAEQGGRDIINGNVFVDGDAFLYEQSSINPAPAPNRWGLNGDIGATGGINVLGSASVSGARNPYTEEPQQIELIRMDYSHNNTFDVAQVFQSAGVGSGTLPSGDILRDVIIKNPSDRGKECGETPNDDYFFEPQSAIGGGDIRSARTPLHLGSNRVYYVDGDVWIHNISTRGFNVDGKVTIAATGNIHVCNNIKYADANDMLGLVALGKYDNSGNRISGGDIFFGDPRYGMVYTVSAMMFAANDFYYNSDAAFRRPAEPVSGFTVNGSFTALNRVVVERDWYTKDGGTGNDTKMAAPARYDSTEGKWVDSETGVAISASEVNSLRHYQMIINYDDRVRNSETQPRGLPRGTGKIFAGFSNWEEL